MLKAKRALFKLLCEKIGQNYIIKRGQGCLIGIQTSFDFLELEGNLPRIFIRIHNIVQECLEEIGIEDLIFHGKNQSTYIVKDGECGLFIFNFYDQKKGSIEFIFNIYICHRYYDMRELNLRYRSIDQLYFLRSPD